MLTRQCSRCHKIIPYGERYCEVCQVVAEKQTDEIRTVGNRYYDANVRDKKTTTFYNSKPWRVLSHTVLQRDEYKCQECGKIASEVHHVIPVKDEWLKRFDINNLISLCASCHNKIRGYQN